MELPAAFKTKYQQLLGDQAPAFFLPASTNQKIAAFESTRCDQPRMTLI